MKVLGIEAVVQFCVDPEKSKAWYTGLSARRLEKVYFS
jgi:hypothetical protein